MVNRIILNETSYHGAGAVKSIVAELAARGLGDDGLHGARAVIRGFIEDDSVDHNIV